MKQLLCDGMDYELFMIRLPDKEGGQKDRA